METQKQYIPFSLMSQQKQELAFDHLLAYLSRSQIKKISKMEALRAKFKVGSTTDSGNSNVTANLSVVLNDSPENKEWSMYTPSGEARLHITNPNAIGFFKAGKQYIATFVECED